MSKVLSRWRSLGFSPDACAQHGLLGVFYPRDPRSRQQKHQNFLFSIALNRLCEKLGNSARSPLVLIKGLHLALDLYQDIGARHMSDIDLLVEPMDLPVVSTALHELGYQRIPSLKFSENNHKQEWQGVEAGFPVVFELHTHLMGEGDFADVATRAHPSFPVQVHVLAPKSNLLYLIQHAGSQHTFTKLSWLLDIHLLWGSHDFDMVRFLEEGRRHQLEGSIVAAFSLLNSLFPDFSVPTPVLLSKEYPSARALFDKEYALDPYGRPLRFLRAKTHVKSGICRLLLYLAKNYGNKLAKNFRFLPKKLVRSTT